MNAGLIIALALCLAAPQRTRQELQELQDLEELDLQELEQLEEMQRQQVTGAEDGMVILFWNLENFFDCTDGGNGASDAEFTPQGARHWTWRRFRAKAEAVAKTLLYLSDGLPAIAGFAEVENLSVVRQIARAEALKAYEPGYVHYDSPDPRGIDVALIYDRRRLTLLRSEPHRVDAGPTRDILEAVFLCRGGDTLTVFVNHHPSKYGGGGSSRRREAAMKRLVELCGRVHGPVVAMGDFNDTPDAATFSLADGVLINKARGESLKGRGTIRYDGRWELIDMFLVSAEMDPYTEMTVPVPSFLMVRDPAHSGYKPLRTYSGPRYTGGISDHLPIKLELSLPF